MPVLFLDFVCDERSARASVLVAAVFAAATSDRVNRSTPHFHFPLPEDRSGDASDLTAGVPSTGFFVNVRTLVAMLGGFCFDALRRNLANVLRTSVLALFL